MNNQNIDVDNLLAACIINIKIFCGSLFEEIFTANFSILHEEIFKLIDAGHTRIAIAAPRGIGKTSIARAVAMRAILFRLFNFIVYISNSATSAELQTENCKRDLISNKLIRQLFGNIKEAIDSPDGMDETFSKAAWVAYGSTLVLPRGAGQQVRGLNWSNFRPELVIIDDLENKDEIRSEENRKKLKEWFWSDLMKTESRYGKGTVFIYIDTIKHEDSLLVDLIESPQWASVQLSICDENYKSYDSNYMTDAEIMEEVEEHRRLGTLDSFYMERMNIPISSEDAVFKQSYFKYFEDHGDKLIVCEKGKDPEELRTYNMLHMTIVDPAKTVKLQSADSAVLTVAVDRQTHRVFVRDIVSSKFYPDELYNEMFRQVVHFNSFLLGYEVTGLNEFIIQPIQNECRSRNLHPILVELNARKGVGESGKAARIATMAPSYRLGYIYHNKSNCSKLEGQLLGFPKSKLWDVMDCLAYHIFIMDKHGVYFDPSDDTDEMPAEDEFDTLECDAGMLEEEMGLLI